MVLHVLAVLVAAMLFGTTGTAQVLGPDGTTPLSVGAMRLIVGGIAIAAITFPSPPVERGGRRYRDLGRHRGRSP